MRGEILGAERRRRWSTEEKLSIVTSVGIDGATVTQIAQRHDVTRQQIYGWRRELKQKGLLGVSEPTCFVPVELPALLAEDLDRADEGMAEQTSVELVLRCGRRLNFDGQIDGPLLTRLIRVVEAA